MDAYMFCPLCKTEYREGFFTCADCSVPLVAELPPIEKSRDKASHAESSGDGPAGEIRSDDDLVVIFETLNQLDILMVKSLLDDERIPYHFSGDYFSMSGYLVSPARLFVPFGMKGRVMELLKELQLIA